MKLDGGLSWSIEDRESAARSAKLGEQAGFDRLFSHETANDPFLPLALAAGAANVDLGTYVAIAFARNPMTLAATANDLQQLTGGRLVLGLGSQVKAHITRRFSMPWSAPARRMREYILALHAIWDSWHDGAPLDFDGEFYHHTLSSPMFNPGPGKYGRPKVMLAAVGPRMTEVAGEVADGVLCHGFTSPSYIEQVTLPALQRGMAKAGRDEAGKPEVGAAVFMATAAPGAGLEREVARVRQQISFYGSTPAYRGVLEHHGWGALHEELHKLSREQRWDDMSGLIDDEVLHTFAVVAQADQLADELLRRFGHLVDALRITLPFHDAPATWGPVLSALKHSK